MHTCTQFCRWDACMHSFVLLKGPRPSSLCPFDPLNLIRHSSRHTQAHWVRCRCKHALIRKSSSCYKLSFHLYFHWGRRCTDDHVNYNEGSRKSRMDDDGWAGGLTIVEREGCRIREDKAKSEKRKSFNHNVEAHNVYNIKKEWNTLAYPTIIRIIISFVFSFIRCLRQTQPTQRNEYPQIMPPLGRACFSCRSFMIPRHVKRCWICRKALNK